MGSHAPIDLQPGKDPGPRGPAGLAASGSGSCALQFGGRLQPSSRRWAMKLEARVGGVPRASSSALAGWGVYQRAPALCENQTADMKTRPGAGSISLSNTAHNTEFGVWKLNSQINVTHPVSAISFNLHCILN